MYYFAEIEWFINERYRRRAIFLRLIQQSSYNSAAPAANSFHRHVAFARKVFLSHFFIASRIFDRSLDFKLALKNLFDFETD